jgi:hypothetical protein
MPRYRVTLRRTTVEIVEAPNPYQAAIVARDLGGEGVEVANVAPAVGRPNSASATRSPAKAAKVQKAQKKRRPLSPEARAKLAQNLVKARAARAAKHRAAQRTAKKTATTKNAAKKTATKR